MYGVTIITALHVALLTTTASEYQQAYNRAESAGRPFLVLVTAKEHAESQTMKDETLPRLRDQGLLEQVVFAHVDTNAKPALARELLRGRQVPQLVLFTPWGKLWRRTELQGARAEGEIAGFLQHEIAKGQEIDQRSSSQDAASSVDFWQAAQPYSLGGS